jgi:hypothetical protein
MLGKISSKFLGAFSKGSTVDRYTGPLVKGAFRQGGVMLAAKAVGCVVDATVGTRNMGSSLFGLVSTGPTNVEVYENLVTLGGTVYNGVKTFSDLEVVISEDLIRATEGFGSLLKTSKADLDDAVIRGTSIEAIAELTAAASSPEELKGAVPLLAAMKAEQGYDLEAAQRWAANVLLNNIGYVEASAQLEREGKLEEASA